MTIVVLLILAGITIAYLFGDNSIFNRANEAKFKARWSTYKEQADVYTTWKIASSMNVNVNGINAGDTLLKLIEIEADVDIKPEDINTQMSEIVNNIESQDERYAVVYHGELCYVLDDHNRNGERDAKWCLEIGIPVLELKRPSGTNIKDGSYEYVNGVYMCTPDLTGFNENYTRYVNENENGVMEPGNWIFSKATEDWYNYTESKWANVVTENMGIECYYTWIPRYCFKLNKGSQRADVKLIDLNNGYKDPYTEEETIWEELEKQGYQVPEAFQFNGQDLPGYWAMKYNLGDAPTTTTIFYNMKVTRGIITITNTQITNGNDIVKCVVSLNSEEAYTETDIANISTKKYELKGMRKGDNVINITGYNSKGEMIGSYTMVYASSIVNPPDRTGFDPDSTFYVLYDENDNEYSTVPLSEEPPTGWYNYDSAEWANIVVRNNDAETYYTWIPRYEFYLVGGQTQQSVVKFIDGTKGGTGSNRAGVTSGYQVPEAFKFNGKELTGYWAMKYNVGETDTSTLNAEVAYNSSSITIKGIKGSLATTGLTYNYYISGKPRTKDSKPDKTTTNPEDSITFEGLTSGIEYVILVEIRNGKQLVGSLTKRVKTAEPNKPELTGFNPDCTYYVLYDDSGNETIGEKITKDGSNMPDNWYDYSKQKWANVVTQNNGTKTYFTWIPRYEFKLDGNKAVQRSDVRFLSGTSSETRADYQVPEAFRFNNKDLKGFWAMKYNVGE